MSISLFHERMIVMAKSNKNLYFTITEREIIQRIRENNSTKVAVATTHRKDTSNIGKEIKAHRKHSYIYSYYPPCIDKVRCKNHHVCHNYPDLVVFKCKRRNKSTIAFNDFSKFQHCRFDKITYYADFTSKEYTAELIKSRERIITRHSKF